MPLRSLLAGLAMVAAFALVACASRGSAAPPASSGYEGGVAGLDRYDPLTYWDAWSGDLSLPQLPHAAITEDEWSRLVLRQRILGLKGLSDWERQALLRGGVKAYLTLVTGAEKRYIADGLGSEDTVERYHASNALNIVLDAAEHHSSGATFDYAGNVQPAVGATSAKYFGRPPRSAAADQSWTAGAGGSWTCRTEDARTRIALLGATYLDRLARTALGTYRATVTYSGRSAVLVEVSTSAGKQYEWFDERTLFPIGLSLPPDRPAGGFTAPSREIQLISVNPDKPITRPAGTCAPQ